MILKRYGDAGAPYVLVQPVDEHEISAIGSEVAAIRDLSPISFELLAVQVDNRNDDLTPWAAPALFGKKDFGGAAARTLAFIENVCADADRRYVIGGYSLAGLFALWAACQADRFAAVAAASPSVWFPSFTDHLRQNPVNCAAVYLSLGDRENQARDPIVQCQKILGLLQNTIFAAASFFLLQSHTFLLCPFKKSTANKASSREHPS